MTSETAISVGCFASSVPQALAAIIVLYDRFHQKRKGVVALTGLRALILALLLVFGTAASCVLGLWILNLPTMPQTSQKPAPVSAPCSPTKTGPATTYGKSSPAISGNGNAVNYGQQPTPPKR